MNQNPAASLVVRLNSLPIRVRLTLWYSLVFATALLCLGFACLWMVHSAITNLETQELRQRVKSVRQFLNARPKGEMPEQLRTAFTTAYDVYHGHKWLQVIDEHGVWVYRSSHVSGPFSNLVLPQHAPADGYYFTYTAEGANVRALIEPIEVNGVRYTVQTGLTLDRALSILSNFRAHLALLTALGLIISSLAGYFMSRKALAPIAAIASEAQRINDRNLNVRLPEPTTQDELAALSRTLNQMLSRIESGYHSVLSFTANAAHELRSPVALLRAETEVALAFPRDVAFYRDTCSRVLDQSVQIASLIDQLLALARADAGVESFNPVSLNVPDLLEEVAGEWAQRFSKDGIQFNVPVASSEMWVRADLPSLKRLLHILLENAWRYTPSRQSATLSCQEIRDVDAPAVEIIVADTGVGIADEDQSRIFDRFCRAARPVHGDFAGSGLGLVLAQGIANRHHSRIELQSTLGQGSRFSLTLPMAVFARMEVLQTASSASDSIYR